MTLHIYQKHWRFSYFFIALCSWVCKIRCARESWRIESVQRKHTCSLRFPFFILHLSNARYLNLLSFHKSISMFIAFTSAEFLSFKQMCMILSLSKRVTTFCSPSELFTVVFKMSWLNWRIVCFRNKKLCSLMLEHSNVFSV